MKRLLFVIMACLFLAGCGQAARQSGFWNHSSMYRTWSHMGFSWCGYKKPTAEAAQKSQEQKWWGIPVTAAVSK
jgi:thiamine biosynthesis lipoprotein ApbE